MEKNRHHITEEKKQRLKEYQENYREEHTLLGFYCY